MRADMRRDPARPPPRFDIQDNDSEDDVATVMVDTSGTDLSAQIEQALGRNAPRPGPPAAPWPPAGHIPAPMAPAAQHRSFAPSPAGMSGQDFSLEHLLENQPDNSGVKRALIVATVLLIIVLTAVVLLWLGQEGRL